jgi:hypothetical protein
MLASSSDALKLAVKGARVSFWVAVKYLSPPLSPPGKIWILVKKV